MDINEKKFILIFNDDFNTKQKQLLKTFNLLYSKNKSNPKFVNYKELNLNWFVFTEKTISDVKRFKSVTLREFTTRICYDSEQFNLEIESIKRILEYQQQKQKEFENRDKTPAYKEFEVHIWGLDPVKLAEIKRDKWDFEHYPNRDLDYSHTAIYKNFTDFDECKMFFKKFINKSAVISSIRY